MIMRLILLIFVTCVVVVFAVLVKLMLKTIFFCSVLFIILLPLVMELYLLVINHLYSFSLKKNALEKRNHL